MRCASGLPWLISADEFWLSLRWDVRPLRRSAWRGAQLRLPGLMSIHLNRRRTGSYGRSAGCHWRSHGAQCRTVASMAASHGRENTWR
jgi:hypothetical protein